jgi:putative ABC transport system permease protein
VTRHTFGARLYRRLLRLYPREFQEEYGAEMSCLYRDRVRDEGAALKLWLALLADVLRTAPKEQLNVLMRDIRHAFRLFVRTPIVTATALLTIALGVGGSTAVFSVVHAVLLRPLPYPAPDRLVELFEDNPRANLPMLRVSTLNYLSWAERTTSTEALAAFGGADVTLTDHGEPERLPGSAITASMFSVLGLPPLAGRGFRAEDERPGAPRVAVIAEALWRRRFGGDAAIVGQSITLNGERHQVIGVVPRAFREVGRAQIASAGGPQVFVPLTIDPARENRGNHVVRVVGRLRPGVSLDRARDEMRHIAAALEQEFPATNKGWGVRLETLYDSMLDERVRPSLLVLLAAVGMVLLIACANVANVLLARGVSRQRELALRTALGAGRSRLVRQLVTESVSLAVVSGTCGLLLAVFAVQTLRGMLPPTLTRIDEINVDATVLGLGLLLSLASGLFMGLVPAVRASRVALVPSLAQHGKGVAGPSGTLVGHVIVVAQMALATMLLVGAALLLQSFVRLQQVRPGFDPEGVITARISLPRAQYPDAARTWGFWRQLLESVDGMPQVQSVAVGITAPFGPGVRATGRAQDRARASSSTDEAAGIAAVEHMVSPDYFQALGLPLLVGRSFGQQDGLGSPLVAVVSENVARQLWADKTPVGQTLDWNGRQHEVVGVVGDIRGGDGRGRTGGGLDREPSAAVYLSAIQFPQRTMTLLVRTAAEPSAIVPAIARAVQDIDPAQPVYQARRLRDWLDESAAQPRFTTTLSGVFALVALLLAAVGVYGVLSYSVAQRTQEIGVRMAIGARRGQVMGLVLRDGMAWALSGITVGLLSAFVLSRGLGTLLFGVTARDPITYVTVGGMLAVVASIACCIPAARATRIDPVIALRAE